MGKKYNSVQEMCDDIGIEVDLDELQHQEMLEMFKDEIAKMDDKHKNEMTEVYVLLSQALKAICLTRDYVGEDLLPAIEGWTWYDVGLEIAEAMPNTRWATQFNLRVEDYKSKKRDEGDE